MVKMAKGKEIHWVRRILCKLVYVCVHFVVVDHFLLGIYEMCEDFVIFYVYLLG